MCPPKGTSAAPSAPSSLGARAAHPNAPVRRILT
jgi:hypothetical protein